MPRNSHAVSCPWLLLDSYFLRFKLNLHFKHLLTYHLYLVSFLVYPDISEMANENKAKGVRKPGRFFIMYRDSWRLWLQFITGVVELCWQNSGHSNLISRPLSKPSYFYLQKQIFGGVKTNHSANVKVHLYTLRSISLFLWKTFFGGK